MKNIKEKLKWFVRASLPILVGIGIGIGLAIYMEQQNNQAESVEFYCNENTAGFRKKQENQTAEEQIYYWVSDGAVYHVTKDCPTLARSKEISGGTVPPSDRRICKVCS